MKYVVRIRQGDVKTSRIHLVGSITCTNLRAAQKLSRIINRNDEGFEARTSIRFHVYGNAIEILPSDLAYVESEFARALENIRDDIRANGGATDQDSAIEEALS
jgi:hypothetical protein